MKLRKIISIGLILILSLSVAACSKGQEDNNIEFRGDENQDKELTGELLDEEEVDLGQIYIRDEWVIGAIIIKDDVSEDRAKEIADKYANKLKEKYEDKKVNVQVILKGKNVANIELE